jgi:hypothetical protein
VYCAFDNFLVNGGSFSKASAPPLFLEDENISRKSARVVGRLAEACSARERPGRGSRWCGLNDRTLTCGVVLRVGPKATQPANNIRYHFYCNSAWYHASRFLKNVLIYEKKSGD